MVQKNASDLFFSTGAPPNLKAEGHTMPIGDTRMGPGQVKKLAYSIMTDDQIKEFEATMEGNLAISMSGLGRFRVNVFRQRGDAAMVIRYIKGNIPSPEQLNLPSTLKKLIMEPRGLILVVGSTGSGKTVLRGAQSGIDQEIEKEYGVGLGRTQFRKGGPYQGSGQGCGKDNRTPERGVSENGRSGYYWPCTEK